jgi:hypothetical protein
MQTIELEIYNFSELSETAKQKARDWYREGAEYGWHSENRDSIQKFCDRYGATLRDWNLSPFEGIHYRLEMPPGMFRGLKLRDVNRDEMPTGYYLDSVLYMTFFDEWKRTSNPRAAFNAAIYAGFEVWRDDWEHSLSDESIDETIEANEYTFTANGKFFPV